MAVSISSVVTIVAMAVPGTARRISDDLGGVARVRRRHRVARHAGEVRAQHCAPWHARVGSRGLKQVRPGARMTDGAQQLADDGHDEQTPVDVIEAANTSPDGIHGALSHDQSMPHRGRIDTTPIVKI